MERVSRVPAYGSPSTCWGSPKAEAGPASKPASLGQVSLVSITRVIGTGRYGRQACFGEHTAGVRVVRREGLGAQTGRLRHCLVLLCLCSHGATPAFCFFPALNAFRCGYGVYVRYYGAHPVSPGTSCPGRRTRRWDGVRGRQRTALPAGLEASHDAERSLLTRLDAQDGGVSSRKLTTATEMHKQAGDKSQLSRAMGMKSEAEGFGAKGGQVLGGIWQCLAAAADGSLLFTGLLRVRTAVVAPGGPFRGEKQAA